MAHAVDLAHRRRMDVTADYAIHVVPALTASFTLFFTAALSGQCPSPKSRQRNSLARSSSAKRQRARPAMI
jgi:hypothetical protein